MVGNSGESHEALAWPGLFTSPSTSPPGYLSLASKGAVWLQVTPLAWYQAGGVGRDPAPGPLVWGEREDLLGRDQNSSKHHQGLC